MIKFFLHQEDGKTYFAVLEMDEKQRVYGRARTMPNGIRISSHILPALDNDYVYLRGRDSNEDEKLYVTTVPVDKNKIIEALREWATTGGFFPEEAKPAQVSSSQSVFSF